MDIRSLSFFHIRWIERCAARIAAKEPDLEHMAALQHALELWRVCSQMDPVDVAEGFATRQMVVL